MRNQPLKGESELQNASDQKVPIRQKESELSARLIEVMGQESVTEFGRRCGIGEATLRNIIKTGAWPRTDNLIAIADAANVNIEWLATGRGPKMRGASQTQQPKLEQVFDQAYSERVRRPATGTLPELLRTQLPLENEYFKALWPLFTHLWATNQLRWLPDHITLEQAAGLVSEASELAWLRGRGEAPFFKGLDEANQAAGRVLFYKAWVVHMNVADSPAIELQNR